MTASPFDFVADLGNWGLKLATPSLEPVQNFAWREAAEQDRLRKFALRFPSARVLLACSSAQGWSSIHSLLPPNWQVELAAVPTAVQVLSTGTGIDRILASYEAWQLCAGAVVVADCGTAFTVDAMDAEGRFHGGAIGAGLGLQEKALATACPHLAMAEEEASVGIPTHTAAAVTAGTKRALAYAVAALAQDFLSALGPASLILSGGDAHHLEAYLPGWRRHDHLVLHALHRMARVQAE